MQMRWTTENNSTQRPGRKVKRLAKLYLPPAAIRGIQKGIHVSRRAKLRMEAAIHPRRFLDDPFPKIDLHYARPEEINYWGRRPAAVFSVWHDRGRVMDGDWDLQLNELPIEETSLYTSYKERMKSGVPWSETPYYQITVKKIQNGEVKWNCRNVEEFDAKCLEWDAVFDSIRTEGYLVNKGEDEVSVNIDRHGRLLLNDGYHRLVFAKLLGVPEIPVTVVVRHRKWHEFRRELYDFTQSGRHAPQGLAYAPLLHMDLRSVPSQHEHDRFDIIHRHVHGKKILDIGAHLGYFCHRFEELGHECVAVESHPDIGYFLKKLHIAQERKFRIVEESIFSFVERERPVVDTVLALSILHHFIKEESSYDQLVKTFDTLRTKEIIFEPHNPAEKQMRGAFRNFDSAAFVTFILENSGLTRVEKIGIAKDGRQIFRLF
jgi:hypothetical protein